jgi:putative tryptophan/tyrosine transport system substrate-binding protein
VRRRDFIALVGGATVAWVNGAGAQQGSKPVLGYLRVFSPGQSGRSELALSEGLAEMGYVEGRNLTIERRFAEGHYDRLPALIEELVGHKVAVIVAGGNVAALAAKRGAGSIPLVFSVGSDPVKLGLVASLQRPGRNATGVAALTELLTLKRLQLIGELLPDDAAIGFLANPDNADVVADMEQAARSSGRRVQTVKAQAPADLAPAFDQLAAMKVSAVVVSNDAAFLAHRDAIVTLAAHHRLPASYEWREFPEVGGLMSYGPSLVASNRQVGVYAGRILGGANPSDLPVQQSTRFELIINLKTAKTLGLTIPPSLLARADEVIE